jgi:hypothetical protein
MLPEFEYAAPFVRLRFWLMSGKRSPDAALSNTNSHHTRQTAHQTTQSTAPNLFKMSSAEDCAEPMRSCEPSASQSKHSNSSGRYGSPLHSRCSDCWMPRQTGFKLSFTTSVLNTGIVLPSSFNRDTRRKGSDFPNVSCHDARSHTSTQKPTTSAHELSPTLLSSFSAAN